MFYSVDGKIVQVGGAFPERKVNTLTFQVQGTQFPNEGSMRFEALPLITSGGTLYYGDGESQSFTFETLRGTRVAVFTSSDTAPNSYTIPRHVYVDENIGLRNVVFEFENPDEVLELSTIGLKLYSQFPKEFFEFTNISFLSLIRPSFLDLGLLKVPENMEVIELIQTSPSKQEVLPDSFFNSKLRVLNVDGVFNLSDKTSSNFFKINQLKSTLTTFRITNSDAIELPDELRECTLISNFQAQGNSYTEFPSQIESMVGIQTLRIGSNLTGNFNLIDFSLNVNIEDMLLVFDRLDISDLATKWIGLKSLNTIVQPRLFLKDDAMFDEFIDQFYDLCTSEGFLDPSSPEAIATGYPDQFRDITHGESVLTQTGAIQAPAGFLQGVDNGNPANQGEKIYVLKENYGHIITTAQP